MQARDSRTIKSACHDLAVKIEDRGEHHMGASTVLLVPSRPIGGVSQFETTNGNAFFTPDGDALVLNDACVILWADLGSDEIFHLEPPKGWCYANVRVEEDSLLSDVFDVRGSRERITPISVAKIKGKFNEGFGPVKSGRFPSAYP